MSRGPKQYLHRTVLYLDTPTHDRLHEEAARTGRPLGPIIREAVQRYLRSQRRAGRATGSAG